MRVFSFAQTKQGGGKKRVIDEVLHVVVLAFLFGFSAHLVRHILPVTAKQIKALWTHIIQIVNTENPLCTNIPSIFVGVHQIMSFRL